MKLSAGIQVLFCIVKTNILPLILAGMFCACGGKKETVFPTTRRLTAEKIPLKEILSPTIMTVKNGQLVIFSGNGSDSLIYFYSTPDLRFLGAGGRKGEGPDEFSGDPNFCGNSEERLLLTQGANILREARLDTATGKMALGTTLPLGWYDAKDGMRLIDDSTLVYLTYFINLKKYDIARREMLENIDLLDHGSEKSTFNLNMGYMAATDSTIAYVYRYKNRIDFFDAKTFRLKKTVEGPGEIRVSKDNWKQTKNYHYNVVAGKNLFYVTRSQKLGETSLQVFDNRGNPMIEYTYDLEPHSFTVDERLGYVYAANYDNENSLIRYKL